MKQRILIAIGLFLLSFLLLPKTILASSDNDIELSRQAAQSFISLPSIIKAHPLWESASLVNQTHLYNLDDQIIAYAFSIKQKGKDVGHIIVGNGLYKYHVLEASERTYPLDPIESELKSALKRDLNLDSQGVSINKSKYLYLGYASLFAEFQVGENAIDFDMHERHAYSKSAMTNCMFTPEEYLSQSKKAVSRNATGSISVNTADNISGNLTGYVSGNRTNSLSMLSSTANWLDVPIQNMADSKIPEAHRNNNNCGPTSGAMVDEFYFQSRGCTNFADPTYNQYLHTWPDDEERLYTLMYCNNRPPAYAGTLPPDAASGFKSYASERGYSFNSWHDVAYDYDFENTVIPHMDANEPFMVLFRSSPYYPPNHPCLHWCVVDGYNIIEDGTRYIWVNNPWDNQDGGKWDQTIYDYGYNWMTWAVMYPTNYYSLTVNTNGSGNVSSNPNMASYVNGTNVTLTATPNTGWTFNSWGGVDSSNGNTATVSMNSNRTITATFAQIQYTLTTTVSPANSGSVTKSPNQSSYNSGAVVTITANPNSGYSFVNWTGDTGTIANVNAANTTITMNGNYSIQANFISSGGNLLTNPGFENDNHNNQAIDGNFQTWSNGTNNPPDNWGLFGTNSSVAQSTSVKPGYNFNYSVALTRNGYDAALYQNKGTTYNGQTLTYGCWVWCSVANTATIAIRDDAGVTFSSSYHPGDSAWHWLTVTRLISSTTNSKPENWVNNNNATAYFDGAELLNNNSPSGWYLFGTGAMASETTYAPIYTGSYRSALITRNGNDTALYQNQGTTYNGQALNYGCWVWCSTPNTAKIAIRDDVDVSFSCYHPGDSQWHWLNVTRIITATTNSKVENWVLNNNTTAYFDSNSLIIMSNWLNNPGFENDNYFNQASNGNFQTWSNGTNSPPDNWGLFGTNSSVAQSTSVKPGYNFNYSVALTRNGYDAALYQNKGTTYNGQTLTYGCWVWCSQQQTARIALRDDNDVIFSDYHQGNSDWEWLTVTRTIYSPTNSKPENWVLNNNNTTAYFCGSELLNSNSPTGWNLFGTGAITSQAAYAPIYTGSSYSALLTRNGNDSALYQNQGTTCNGKTLTYKVWVWCSVANTATIAIRDDAGVTFSSSYHPGDSAWHWLTVTRLISSTTNSKPENWVNNNNATAYFDNATLTVSP